MQPLEIAKGIPAAIACKDDYDVGLASTTTAAVAAVTAADELNRTRSPSPELVTRRRSNDNHINNNNINNTTMPDSPRSFDSNELFEDVVDESNGEYGMDRITDDDLERLMWNSDEGQRRDYRRRQHKNNTARPSSMFQQYHRIRSWLCSCCPPRRQHKIGNMIILLPYYCVTKFECGIMGPHWFGPVACFTLLSGATSRLVPRSYCTIGPITGQICLGLYLVSVLLLGLVVCRDPGVVRSTAMMEDEEALVEQENVDDEGINGIDGRVESGRAGGRSGNGRGLTGRGSGGGLSEGGRGLNTNGIRRRGGVDWRYCDICSLYQPPRAVHCPDCNVCIKGWDHHCPWMGTCIGEKNYTLFLAFNLTWLIYLFFAIVWVLNYPLHDLGPPRGVAPDDDDET